MVSFKLLDSVLAFGENERSLEVWMSHGDKVISVPQDLKDREFREFVYSDNGQ